MSDKLRLMELCTSPSKGGLELYYANISNQLQQDFKVLNVIAEESQIRDKLAPQSSICTLRKISHYFPLFAAIKLARMIDKHQIQLIHMHWNKDLTVAVFAKLFSKMKPKLVLTRHMQFPARKDSAFHRFLYSNIDHIIAVTQTMKEDMQCFIPKQVQPPISVNYLGIDPIEPSPESEVKARRLSYDPDQNLFLIALVGRIDPYKGHDLLVDAMVMAKEKHLPFKALIVGHAMDEKYLQALKARVKQHELESFIEFTGFVDNPRQLMQACDTVILTTIEETFGLVLIEAMSIGVPVIGSNRGGVPEIIAHEKTGLLFESGSSESLFHALNYLYEKPESAMMFASESMAMVQDKFSADGHKQRLVTCLNGLIEPRGEA